DINEKGLVLFRRYHEKPFIIYDPVADSITPFGENIFGDDMRIAYLNNRSSIIFDSDTDIYIRVYQGHPLIEIYDKDLALVTRIDVGHIPIINERIVNIDELRRDNSPQQQNVSYILFNDITYINNTLSLLVYRQGIGARDIVSLKLEDNEITEINTYLFDDKEFRTLRSIEHISPSLMAGFSNTDVPSLFTIELN
ncbi:MAG: hypothetical protein LAT81_16245, partial [Oceanicaulis sp.]|nr:hypothetical protein [Oceanicaulis sp.]